MLAEPTSGAIDLLRWVTQCREKVVGRLHSAGGILFRGFEFRSEDFEELVETIAGSVLADPTRVDLQVGGRVYLSTKHPPEHVLFFHNETSWQYTWPTVIAFYCSVPPITGGETLMSDCRAVLDGISAETLELFATKQILHVRNFGDIFGVPWESAFGTADRGEVEEICSQNDVAVEWRPRNRLRTRHVRPATLTHHVTGETLWFNHGAHYHVTTNFSEDDRQFLRDVSDEDMPVNTYFGDGSPLPPAVVEEVRAAYWGASSRFPWQQGDVLVLDNELIAHGRGAYTGDRAILVAQGGISRW